MEKIYCPTEGHPSDIGDRYQKSKIDREIYLAKKIQQEMFKGFKTEEKYGDAIGISIPAREVSGDYFDFYKMPNGKLRIIIADVMGKGLPASMLMIYLKGALKSVSECSLPPSQTLDKVNQALVHDLRSIGAFITMFCADWDPQNQTFDYANAGHHFPIIFRHRTQSIESMEAEGVMIGGLYQFDYPERRVKLSKEEVVVFYTDGIFEAKNQDSKRYKLQQIKEVLFESYHRKSEYIRNQLVQSIKDYTQTSKVKDDITFIVFKP